MVFSNMRTNNENDQKSKSDRFLFIFYELVGLIISHSNDIKSLETIFDAIIIIIVVVVEEHDISLINIQGRS